MSDQIETVLHDIDTRLRIVEADLTRMAGMRKILIGVSFGLIIQAIMGAVGYGQLLSKVDTMSASTGAQDVSTALSVLRDHGTEFENLRSDISRIRGTIDQIWVEQAKVRDIVAESTKSRFYREDAYPIYNRIDALENRVERNEGYIFGPASAANPR